MAKAIRQIKQVNPAPEEWQAASMSAVVKAAAENGESLIKLLEIIKQLDGMGVLNAMEGLLQNRVDVAEIALGQLNQPAMYHAIKNGMNVFKFLGSIDPEQLQTILAGITSGFEKAAQSGGQESLWKLGKSMRSPEVKRSLAMMAGVLAGMGEAMEQNHSLPKGGTDIG
ncbi:DUF1641 domain-containing protein [Heyndrickxia coagulans]|uniref:DUF1641 domain-containing protein n=1 Tax=Heyndrickxia coagulans TaxID=1398 RepID=UPI000E4F39F1|nr:DUF1641 domain-containing protein [Heyndrickxia coagulans]MED4404466.1 DUF1641 domain-containing protein [Heyndrickxia coagulans]MED4966130.1 DUF1641 domain-containing protein [Heyndrickxia coagulans]RGR87645.1 DUF1641 domain-containing protein [Heyndrickxia coagulans]RGR98809.1 DUF1641 domain-containing protein [Heyndrickxia coagulans]